MSVRDLRDLYTANGLCRTGCARPKKDTSKLCEECTRTQVDRVNAYRASRRAKGLCKSGCKRPLATKTMCCECAAMHSKRNRVAEKTIGNPGRGANPTGV